MRGEGHIDQFWGIPDAGSYQGRYMEQNTTLGEDSGIRAKERVSAPCQKKIRVLASQDIGSGLLIIKYILYIYILYVHNRTCYLLFGMSQSTV